MLKLCRKKKKFTVNQFRSCSPFLTTHNVISIETYYLKEFLFGCIILYFLIQISIDYQFKFKGPLTYIDVKTDEKGNEVAFNTESNGMYDFASLVFEK